jgi:hypothetical protein
MQGGVSSISRFPRSHFSDGRVVVDIDCDARRPLYRDRPTGWSTWVVGAMNLTAPCTLNVGHGRDSSIPADGCTAMAMTTVAQIRVSSGRTDAARDTTYAIDAARPTATFTGELFELDRWGTIDAKRTYRTRTSAVDHRIFALKSCRPSTSGSIRSIRCILLQVHLHSPESCLPPLPFKCTTLYWSLWQVHYSRAVTIRSRLSRDRNPMF